MEIVKIFLQAFGGVAIFVFGMKMMSDGLYNVAGQRMKSVLQFFASNRFVAIFSGAVVTAAVQSSAASTVMVIGFVNAGLLDLVQAVGIIFGSNIGTTVTAQLIAFHVDWLIMPVIITGLILSFLKKQIIRRWGETLLGLGFLFFGMDYMGSQLNLLGKYDWFLSLFRLFDCTPVNGFIPVLPLIGAIFVGLLVTVLIQSSSACSGIVIALGASGIINIYTAIVLILGSNIGTTITAMLAAIPANRIAKQAALAHVLFNVIGVLLFIGALMITMDGVPVFMRVLFWISADGTLPRQIANAHTLFNVLTTLVLLPFIPLLARICSRIIPIHAPKIKFQRLEPHLLNTPLIALGQTVSALRRMFRKSMKMIDKSLSMLAGPQDDDEQRIEKLARREARVDEMQHEITDYLTQLMRHSLTRKQADSIPLLIHCTNDAERIGDHTAVILDIVKRLRESGSGFSAVAMEEIGHLQSLLNTQAETTVSLLENRTVSLEMEEKALAVGRELRALCEQYEACHIKRLADGLCQPATAVCYIELLAEFRKISRHVTNIAERSVQFAEYNISAQWKHRAADGTILVGDPS